jgi:hypothetical protein
LHDQPEFICLKSAILVPISKKAVAQILCVLFLIPCVYDYNFIVYWINVLASLKFVGG